MKIIPATLKLAEHVRNAWHVNAAHGTPVSDVTSPSYWTHVAKNLTVGDRIEVIPESREWLAELYVVGLGPTGVQVRLLALHDFQAKAEQASALASGEKPEYEVKYAGGVAKWRVTRTADKQVMAEGLLSREAGHAWLAEHAEEALV